MLKVRVILRNVATIAACLAVNVLFLSCDENNDENTGNGNKVAVTKVTIEPPASAIIAIGGTLPLKAKVEPDDATDKTVTWSTDKKEVATVNATTGVVTAVSAGKANIIVTTKDGGKTDKCEVTVSATSGENSDKVLIGGSWLNSSSSGTSLISNIYFFYENGTFKYNRTSTGNSYGYIVEGKYTTSKGTMYMTDLNFYTSDKIDEKEKWADKTFEYSIVKENNFYYLTINSLGNYEGYSESMVPVRFSKSAE
jgi:uncharacterized protein YjdB